MSVSKMALVLSEVRNAVLMTVQNISAAQNGRAFFVRLDILSVVHIDNVSCRSYEIKLVPEDEAFL